MSWDPVSRLLFPAPPASYGADSFKGEELIFVPKALELGDRCPLEQRVPCLLLRYPTARYLLIYLHTNAEDIGKCYAFCSVMRMAFHIHVLAVEYPGYGLCPGGPATAASVTENAFAVFRFVREVLKWPTDSIKVLGRSIGTGPAILLAVQYKIAGLILIAPFLSIKDLLHDKVDVLSHLIQERFPSKDRIHLVRSPALIIHGQKDSVVDCKHGAALYALCRSRKLLVCPEEMQHNSGIFTDPSFFEVPMFKFFRVPEYCCEEMHVPLWVFRRHDEVAGLARVPSGSSESEDEESSSSLPLAPPWWRLQTVEPGLARWEAGGAGAVIPLGSREEAPEAPGRTHTKMVLSL
mmetsp:Transcript_110216/g.235343  ORF Transcript_110216/g.235343 Transcript_110216/m.235343 type:complete len:350 (+) Transcript_110216:103-1152(+)